MLKIEKPVEFRSSRQPGSLNDPYFHFQGVSKSFDAQKVLEDVTFRVFPGETVCVLGRSGVKLTSVIVTHDMRLLEKPITWFFLIMAALFSVDGQRRWSVLPKLFCTSSSNLIGSI
jgi:ABC-type transporter Mla maintaining outer membrane lipid asymmetry ATPase subunit MlaF